VQHTAMHTFSILFPRVSVTSVSVAFITSPPTSQPAVQHPASPHGLRHTPWHKCNGTRAIIHEPCVCACVCVCVCVCGCVWVFAT